MGSPFVLVSWNIYQGLHYSSRRDGKIKNDAVERHLTELDADVLVLPEAWKFRQPNASWSRELADSLGYELHEWVGHHPSRPRDVAPWRMVILTRIAARRLDDVVLPEFGRFGQRAIVRVQLDESGLILGAAHMYGIHILLRHGPAMWSRERAAFRDAALGLDIVAGDMNIWGPIVRRDTRPKRAAVKGRTFPAHRPHSQIDHIMVSDRVDVIDGRVLDNLGSDHRAVRAVLRARH